MKHELSKFTIRHILERSTQRHAKRVALTVIGNKKNTYTYEKLKEDVDSIATYLMKHKVKKGDKIGVLGESSPQWGVAYLSVVSSGAIAVPILPDFSAKEVSTIIKHSELSGIFVSSKSIEKVPTSIIKDKT
ncbi:MAG: long-chain fatty acid--CoA ligase, partial [Spirochaetia bacterium]|nr:long-chain fatty acid--CoA ligase [Spirochaetia bacterium]